MTAPISAPIPGEPAAQPTSNPAPMQATRTASNRPPAPAGLRDDGEAACVSRASVPEVTGELVTRRLRQTTRFRGEFVRLAECPREPPARPPRARERRERRRHLGGATAACRAVRARRAEPAWLPAGPRRGRGRLRGRGGPAPGVRRAR